MNERALLKISLIGSIIGIIILFILSSFTELEENQISNLEDDNVKVKGIITKITDRETIMIIEIAQQNKIEAIIFKEENISLEKGDEIEITGSTDEYEGRQQIIVDKIKFTK